MPRRAEHGAALVEFAVVFPVQLFVVLGILQLALAFGAQQVVQYSSYCAARAAIVNGPDGNVAQQAADKASQLALLPVTWAPLLNAQDAQSLATEVAGKAGDQWSAASSQTSSVSAKASMLWSSRSEHHLLLKIPLVDLFLTGNESSALLPWTDPTVSATEGGSSAPT